jgi:hypothetical protein
MLGCTARRAGLGIHRSQAGRRGSSPGRGRRVKARRTTTTPSTNSATSATASGRSRPGGAARAPAPGRPGRETTATAPGRRCGPGRGAPPSPPPGRRCGPDAVPRPGLRSPGGGTRLRHCARAPSAPGRCRPGRCPGRATESPHVAVSRVPLGRLRGADRRAGSLLPGRGDARPVPRGGPVPGPRRPEAIAEDAVHCAARAAVRVAIRALTGGRSPGRTASLGRRHGPGRQRWGASAGAGTASE